MLRFSAILVLGVVVSTEIQVLARLLRPVMGLSSGARGVVHESVLLGGLRQWPEQWREAISLIPKRERSEVESVESARRFTS